MTATGLHITVSRLFRRSRGQTLSPLCTDATQYYHSVTTGHPHSLHLKSLKPFQSLRNLSIKHKTNKVLWVWKSTRSCLKYLLRIEVNTQPQLMGNDRRNEWKSSFLQRQERPGCVCGCGWHMALRFMGWPYPGSKASFKFSTKEKVSRVCLHTVEIVRKKD